MKFHIPTQILRVSTFVVLAAVIVLLFPQYNNSFRYHYEVGKPWGYATLRADFDFPIYKTDEQMAKEEKQLLSTFTPYYKYIPRVQREVMCALWIVFSLVWVHRMILPTVRVHLW